MAFVSGCVDQGFVMGQEVGELKGGGFERTPHHQRLKFQLNKNGSWGPKAGMTYIFVFGNIFRQMGGNISSTHSVCTYCDSCGVSI